jgi:ADP-dependent phosphofructokinase/glucokinase
LTGYGILFYKYFIDKKSIERRDKMTKETLKETVKKITHLDSMKAVKVAFDLSENNQDSINKVMQIVGGNVNNINTLAEEIAKIKKILARFQMTEGLDEQRKN